MLLLAGCRPHELYLQIDYIRSLGVYRRNFPCQLNPASYLRRVPTDAVKRARTKPRTNAYGRRRAARDINSIVEYKHFDTLILVAILLSTLLLMIETPLMIKPDHWVETLFSTCNWWMVFIGEMVLKKLAKGFVCHEHVYLRNWWNILDFAIMMVSIVLMTLMCSAGRVSAWATHLWGRYRPSAPCALSAPSA